MDYKEGGLQEIEIVKEMITRNDYVDARDKLLKVQRHFPTLDNISEMITVCDILFSADLNLLDCGMDWYRVLHVTPAVAETDILHQYHKLSALLEPIKNNFPGTASALRIIQDAFSVLSDPENRSMFDSKRAASLGAYESMNTQEICDDLGHSCCIIETLVRSEETSPSSASCKRAAVCETYGINDVGSPIDISLERTKDEDLGDLLRETEVHSAEISTGTEVTGGIHVVDAQMRKICSKERNLNSDRMNVNINVGKGRPANNVASPVGSDCSSEKPVASNSCDQEFYNFDNIRKAEVFSVGQVWAAYDEENMPRRYARINNIDEFPFRLHVSWLKPAPVTVHERRWCEVGLPIACGIFKLDSYEATVTKLTMFSHMVSRLASLLHRQVEIHPKKREIWAIYKDWEPIKWCSDPEERKGCTLQMVEILTDFSSQVDVMVAGLVEVEGFKNVFRRNTNSGGSECAFTIPAGNLYMFSHNVPAFRFLGGEMDAMFELDPLAVPNILDYNVVKSSEEGSSSEYYTFAHCPPVPPDIEIESMKLRWRAEHFASEQVWAVYDGPDSMPRQYVAVNNVVSGNEVCVTLLEPHPTHDDEIYWVEENLPFNCGSFRAGRTTINLGMSRFSHLVNCQRSTKKSFYKIHPKKGEVWAMYRNWNSRWKQCDFSHYQYQIQIVEIISEFTEESESEMRTGSLTEVPGYMTFFQRQLCNGFELIRTVSRTEMLSFSHRIVAFTVPGIGKHGIPEDSWHLEPDALPLNFGNQF